MILFYLSWKNSNGKHFCSTLTDHGTASLVTYLSLSNILAEISDAVWNVKDVMDIIKSNKLRSFGHMCWMSDNQTIKIFMQCSARQNKQEDQPSGGLTTSPAGLDWTFLRHKDWREDNGKTQLATVVYQPWDEEMERVLMKQSFAAKSVSE